MNLRTVGCAVMMLVARTRAAQPNSQVDLYFDVTTNVAIQTSVEDARFITARLRQIELHAFFRGHC